MSVGELSAGAPAESGGPWWLSITLAVIAAVAAVLGPTVPKWIEQRRDDTDSDEAGDEAAAPARAVSALTIVQDAMDDLQRRLDERERELAAATRRIAELEARIRGEHDG